MINPSSQIINPGKNSASQDHETPYHEQI